MIRINFLGSLSVLVGTAALLHADAYDTLMKRYEKQIGQQERQLQSLRVHLQQKERDAGRWQQKAQEVKTQWSQAATASEHARQTIQGIRDRRAKTRTLADAAEWSATERTLQASAADGQVAYLARERYAAHLTPPLWKPIEVPDRSHEFFLQNLCLLSQSAHQESEEARREETTLRTEEMRWQNEEGQRSTELERLRDRQQALWLRWQEANQKRLALEEEKNQLEQSEQALHVMLNDLREHRDHTLAARQERSVNDQALAALRGSLPWPAWGKVTQNFGRQYSSDLNQLVISNGIKIETGAGHSVRAIQPGKVLFASPFRQYGELVIIQHKSGLTSVYGGLGQIQVKEGNLLAALEAVGTVGENGAFYFELRHDEQPVNPLVYLAPNHRSEISLSLPAGRQGGSNQ